MKLILPGPVVRLFQGDCREIIPAISGVRCCITRFPIWNFQALVNLFAEIRDTMLEDGRLIIFASRQATAINNALMNQRGWFLECACETEEEVMVQWFTRPVTPYALHASPGFELIRNRIESVSVFGELILDPFADDGKVLLIARQVGRAVCGIEQDEAKCHQIVEALHANPSNN